MRILSIELKNFKSFRHLRLPEDDDELSEGLILIRGGNSTGKSSLFEAILWALWGSDAVGLTNDELINFASSFCEVILIFEVSPYRYKIDRSYDPARGMDVTLYIERNGAWKHIADKSRSVASELGSVLNLGLKQALNTLLVRQGEVALIANATPTVLRDLLVKVYNIDLLKQMSSNLENLESDLSAMTKGLEDEYVPPRRIRVEIDQAKTRIDRDEQRLKAESKEVVSTEKLLAEMPSSEELQSIHDYFEELERTKHDLQRATEERNRDFDNAGIVSADADVIRARMASLKKELKRVESNKENSNTEIQNITLKIGEIQGTQEDLSEKISALEAVAGDKGSETTECPTCSKPLTAAERDQIIAEYKATIKRGIEEVTQLKAGQEKHIEETQLADERMSLLTKAIDAVDRVKDKQKEVQKTQSKEEKIHKKLIGATSAAGFDNIESLLEKHNAESLAELQRRIAVLAADLKSLKNKRESIAEDIDREYKHITELEEEEKRMQQMGAEIERLKQLNEHTKYVRRKLVSGFIADFVFQKRLIGIIRNATNKYVKAFTNNQYTSVDLEPTQAKGRSGAGLLLKIWDERDKANKKSSQLSFGDRTAISLGLRLGISRTMSSIRPLKDSPAITPRVRCVLLDEPLGGLDRTRRNSVVSNLVDDQSFRQIFLITHTDIQEWPGVPVVEVMKIGSASMATIRSLQDT